MSTIAGDPPSDLSAGGYNPSMYELLKTVDDPAALRSLDRKQLPQLVEELRGYVLESVARTGGHLSSNLGTVELTIALHYVFDTPEDRHLRHRAFLDLDFGGPGHGGFSKIKE